MCIAQERDAVTTVKLELATPQSPLKQSTTEPLRPSNIYCYLKRRQIVQCQQFDTVYKVEQRSFFINIWEGFLPNIRWEILLQRDKKNNRRPLAL